MDTNTITTRFVEKSIEILQDNLVGVYLHGSAVMGCFNPAKSDLDLIVVVKESMSETDKRDYSLHAIDNMQTHFETMGSPLLKCKSLCDLKNIRDKYQMVFYIQTKMCTNT